MFDLTSQSGEYLQVLWKFRVFQGNLPLGPALHLMNLRLVWAGRDLTLKTPLNPTVPATDSAVNQRYQVPNCSDWASDCQVWSGKWRLMVIVPHVTTFKSHYQLPTSQKKMHFRFSISCYKPSESWSNAISIKTITLPWPCFQRVRFNFQKCLKAIELFCIRTTWFVTTLHKNPCL